MANTDRAGTMKRKGVVEADKDAPKSTKKRKKQKNQTKSNKQKEKVMLSTKPQANRTATPEGQKMVQICSTLKRLEQSRLEAFRRATLPSNALADYLAHCLMAHQEQMRNGQKLQEYGNMLNSDGNKTLKPQCIRVRCRHRPLSDLVSPGHSDSIVVVVTSLAKTYAQRLVAAARRVADVTNWPHDKALSPEHFRQARAARIRAGIDPGLWMQSAPKFGVDVVSDSETAAALGRVNRREELRLAALQAQEDYDAFLKTGKVASTPPLSDEPKEHQIKSEDRRKKDTTFFSLKDTKRQESEEDSKKKNKHGLITKRFTDENPNGKNEESPSPKKLSEPPQSKHLEKEKEKTKEIRRLDRTDDLLDDPAKSQRPKTPAIPPTPAQAAQPIFKAPPAPKPSKPVSSGPMSMEDALLNDLDDDSDSSDDDE